MRSARRTVSANPWSGRFRALTRQPINRTAARAGDSGWNEQSLSAR